MKKFTKLLALGLAAALTFGMTVSAAESPNPDASKESEALVGEVGGIVDVSGNNVTFTAVDAERVSMVNRIAEKYDAEVVTAIDVKLDGPATITVTHPSFSVDKDYVVFHYCDDQVWRNNISWSVTKAGEMQLTSNDWSPIAIYEVVDNDDNDDDDDDDDDDDKDDEKEVTGTVASPKTGAFSVAGYMAVVCLAGALVSSKKARN